MARNLRKPESATASDVELKWKVLKLTFGAKPPGRAGGFVLWKKVAGTFFARQGGVGVGC